MAMGITSVRASFKLVGSEQLAAQGVRFRQVHKGVDSASCRRGSVASPVCGKAANRSEGKVPCAESKPSAERTRPLGCISAPLLSKGFIQRSRPRLVFSDIPVPAHSSVQFLQKWICLIHVIVVWCLILSMRI